jgi:hypothetical protein
MEQGLHEPEPRFATLADELDRGQVHLIRAHLAVADDAVTRELEAGDAEVDYLHSSYFWRKRCSDTLRDVGFARTAGASKTLQP